MKSVFEWIKVSEGLPKDDKIMLVTCQTKKGLKNINRAYYDKDSKSWHGSGSMSGVIAWADIQPFEDGSVKE